MYGNLDGNRKVKITITRLSVYRRSTLTGSPFVNQGWAIAFIRRYFVEYRCLTNSFSLSLSRFCAPKVPYAPWFDASLNACAPNPTPTLYCIHQDAYMLASQCGRELKRAIAHTCMFIHRPRRHSDRQSCMQVRHFQENRQTQLLRSRRRLVRELWLQLGPHLVWGIASLQKYVWLIR